MYLWLFLKVKKRPENYIQSDYRKKIEAAWPRIEEYLKQNEY